MQPSISTSHKLVCDNQHNWQWSVQIFVIHMPSYSLSIIAEDMDTEPFFFLKLQFVYYFAKIIVKLKSWMAPNMHCIYFTVPVKRCIKSKISMKQYIRLWNRGSTSKLVQTSDNDFKYKLWPTLPAKCTKKQDWIHDMSDGHSTYTDTWEGHICNQ
jgi:hypothetical protein